jgi:putrescine transport system permease protein
VSDRDGGSRWSLFAAPGLLWLVLLFLVPLYAVLSVAMGRLHPIFRTAEPVWNPLQWDPSALVGILGELAGGRLTDTALRTLVYVGIAVVLAVVIGYPVAYYVARHAGRWKGLLLIGLILPFWINYLMRMLSWVNLLGNDGMVNTVLTGLGVLDAPRAWLAGQHSTVILGLAYGYLPYFILPLYAALDSMDQRVVEAARDLGASPFQAWHRVTLPLSRQGVLAGAVLVTLPMFGDYYTTNLLSGSPRTRMIGNEIEEFISSGAGGANGASLTVVLMTFVAVLMIYYLRSVARATREARG